MKKLKATLLSLTMLIFSIGWVSAQISVTPALDPGSGTVAPGTTLAVTNVDDEAFGMAMMVFVLWTDKDKAAVELTGAEDEFFAFMNPDGMPSSFTLASGCQLAIYSEGDLYSPPVSIPTDASGEVTVRARYAMIDGEMALSFGGEASFTYTVAGEVEQLEAPVFSPTSGEVAAGTPVAITGYEDMNSENTFVVCYVVDGTDADLEFTEVGEDLYNKMYEKPIKIYKGQTIKARTVEYYMNIVRMSDIVTETYTVIGGDVENLEVPKLTLSAETLPLRPGGAPLVFSCTMDIQEYTHPKNKLGFVLDATSTKGGIEKLEYQVGETVDPAAWQTFPEDMWGNVGTAPVAANPGNTDKDKRLLDIAQNQTLTVHYRVTMKNDVQNAALVLSAVEVTDYGNWSPTNAEKPIAKATVKFNVVDPVVTFTPRVETGLTLVPGAETEVWIRQADSKDTRDIYYRVLSRADADLTSPINDQDAKIEIKQNGSVKYHAPIKVDESMIQDDQFIVRTALRNADGTFSVEETATYAVEMERADWPLTMTITPTPGNMTLGETYEFTINTAVKDQAFKLETLTQLRFNINSDEDALKDVQYAVVPKGAPVVTWKSNFVDIVGGVIDVEDEVAASDMIGSDLKLRLILADKFVDNLDMQVSLVMPNAGFAAAVYANVSLKASIEPRKAADPTFEPAPGYIAKGGTVTLACTTENAKIFYTLDGSEPKLDNATEYTAPIEIDKLTTIKAVAYNEAEQGYSLVSEGVYSIIGIPAVTPASGKVVIDSMAEISLSYLPGTKPEGMAEPKIYYTLDGKEPTAASTPYSGRFKLGADVKVLKAIAIMEDEASGLKDAVSPVIVMSYQMVPAMPLPSDTGTGKEHKLEFGTKIELTCATPGAEIYWILGGNDQVSKDNGTKYEGPIEIKVSTILKAIAYYNGEASKPMSCKYKVNVAAPAFSAPAGWVAEGTELVMTTESAALDTRPDMTYHIVYTTDGTDPEVERQGAKVVIKNGEEYVRPIELTEDIAFKALAWVRTVTGYDVSPITSAAYKMLATPTFDRADGLVEAGTKVTIACATEGAKIYYTTDESDPTAESTPYNAAEGVIINETTILKAVAVMEGVPSAVAEAVFMVVSLEAPVFSAEEGAVDKGTELTWTWDEAYGDAFMQVGVIYVANGKDEDLDIDVETYQALYDADPVEGAHEDGQVYLYMGDEEEPGYTIVKDVTVKARMIGLTVGEAEEGAEPEAILKFSDIATKAYTVKAGPAADTVATPTFNPAAGEVAKGAKVEIACATEGAKLYYTVDGSEPTAESTEYKAAIEINEAMTIKAIAIKGEVKSAVAEAAYTIKQVANEDLELSGVSVYPNPSNGVFNLELPVAATVEVFASNGVLRQRIETGAGLMTLSIDRSGIYFLRITAEGRTTVKRIVVR